MSILPDNENHNDLGENILPQEQMDRAEGFRNITSDLADSAYDDGAAADIMEEAIKELSAEGAPRNFENGEVPPQGAGSGNVPPQDGQQGAYGARPPYAGYPPYGGYAPGGYPPQNAGGYYYGGYYPPQTAYGQPQGDILRRQTPPAPPQGAGSGNVPPQDGQQGAYGARPPYAGYPPYGGYAPGGYPPQNAGGYYYGGYYPPQTAYGQPQGNILPQGSYRPLVPDPVYGYVLADERAPAQQGKKKKHPKNIGLRVFICVLCTVLAASAVLTALYFISPHDETEANLPTQTSGDGAVVSSANTETCFGGSELDMPISDAAETPLLTPAEAAAKVTPSVVGIVVYSPTDTSINSWATGIVLTEDGYIATNDHIYSNIPDAEFIITVNTGEKYDASFIDGDARSDLAVLKIDGEVSLTPAEFGDSGSVFVGDDVIAIGNPYSMSLTGSVTKGVVSATGRRVTGGSSYTMKLIQTDAAVNPGNSGGPLVDLHGRVIGINSSKIQLAGYEGIGFSIPSVTAKNVIESLVRSGYVEDRPRLGISFEQLDFFNARINGLPEGLRIIDISSDSDLLGKGVSAGDIITDIDGRPLSETNDFMDLIEAKSPGDALALKVYKASSGAYTDLSVTLLEDRGDSSYLRAG